MRLFQAFPSIIWWRLLQTYLLKLARSGEDGEKIFLVLESGSRFHTTQVPLTETRGAERDWPHQTWYKDHGHVGA